MKTLNPSFGGVVFNYKLGILYENLVNQKNFTLKMCEETMFAVLYPYYFTKNHYIVNEFNELISNIQSAGLIDHISSRYVSLTNKNERSPISAFTYNNIKGFIKLFLCGCAVAFVSFIVEIKVATFAQKRGRMLKRCVSSTGADLESNNRL